MALYITLGLTVLFFILAFFTPVRRFYERHQIPMSFLLTVLATFLGVFLSIKVSDIQSQNQSREDSILLLNSLTQDARTLITMAQGSEAFNRETSVKSGEFLKQFYPFPIRDIIVKETSLRNYSPEFIVNINRYTSFLESYMDTYRKNELMSTGDFRVTYLGTLKKLIVLMGLEKLYIKGEIDRDAHDLLYRCYFDMGRGYQKEKVPSDSECHNAALNIRDRLPQELWSLNEADK